MISAFAGGLGEDLETEYSSRDVGSYGGTVVVRTDRDERGRTQSYIDCIDIGSIRIKPATPTDIRTVAGFFFADDAGMRSIYDNGDVYKKAMARGVYGFVTSEICSGDFFLIEVDGQKCGFLQPYVDKQDSLRVVPYIKPSFRKTDTMLKAYSTFVDAYGSFYDLEMTHGYTREHNGGMKRLFASVGMVQINEEACCSIEYKVECAVFGKPTLFAPQPKI